MYSKAFFAHSNENLQTSRGTIFCHLNLTQTVQYLWNSSSRICGRILALNPQLWFYCLSFLIKKSVIGILAFAMHLPEFRHLYKPKENSEVINSNVLVKAVTESWDLKIETDHKRSHLQMTSLNDFFCKWFLQMTIASIECLGAEMGRMLVHVLLFAFLFFPNVQVAKSLVCIRGTGNFQSEVNWKVCRWQCKC